MQAFPIGCPLVPDISRAVLNLTEGDKIAGIENEWLGQQTTCPEQSNMVSSHSLGLNSFWGLFLIVGIASFIALIIYGSMSMYEHRHLLKALDAKDLWAKAISFSNCFRKIEEEHHSTHLQMTNHSAQNSRHLQMTNHSILSIRAPSSNSCRSSRSSSSLSNIAEVNLCALRGGNSFV